MKENTSRENAIEYIKYGLNKIMNDSQKLNINLFGFMLLTTVPTIIFGKWSIFTVAIIIIAQVALQMIYHFGIKKEIDKSKIHFVLYVGLQCVYISSISMLGAWRFLVLVYGKVILISLIMIIIYFIVALLIIINGLDKVRKDINEKKTNNTILKSGVFGGMAVLGMGFAKTISKQVSQNQAVTILALLLIILAVFAMLGSVNILKYHLYRKFNVLNEELNNLTN